jgi:hypothetical protein
MKKLAVSLVALATVFAFTSCNSEDTVAPVITVPSDALVIDLGDTEAALKGVTANDDKDKDVTTYLTVEGLDYVGIGTLTYSVKDKANNEGTATRPVTIKAEKLTGVSYSVQEAAPYETTKYVVDVQKSSDQTKVVLSNFYGQSNLAPVFEGDGKSMTFTVKNYPITSGGDNGSIDGTLSYKKSSSNYEFYECKYSVTWSDGEVENHTATYVIK